VKKIYYSANGKSIAGLLIKTNDVDRAKEEENDDITEVKPAFVYDTPKDDVALIYNGVEVEYDNNDNILFMVHYQNNRILQKDRFDNNQLISSVTNEGTSTFYDLENNQQYNCTYQDGKPQTGTMLEFDETGKFIEFKKSYLDGELNGECVEFSHEYNNNKSGHILTIKNFKNGIQHGETRFYNRNQKLLSAVMYLNGEPQNETVYEYAYDGQIYSQTPYVNGSIQGDVTYYQDGTVHNIKSYNFNSLTKEITRFVLLPDSMLTLSYEDDMPFNGQIFEHNELSEYQKGALISKKSYVYDDDTENYRLVSHQQYSDPNGDLSVKRSYYANGKIKKVQEMSYGSVNGTTRSYDSNGKLIAKGVYNNNDFPRSGSFAAFNSNNDADYLILKIGAKNCVVTFYLNGKKVSTLTSATYSFTMSIYDIISQALGMIDHNYDQYKFNE
jgi:antitoxin component YwqK of YwqJK toxin-antitoxin module